MKTSLTKSCFSVFLVKLRLAVYDSDPESFQTLVLLTAILFTPLGNYFISFNVRVDGISTGKVAVQFRINNAQPAVLHAYEGLPVNTPNQLSINTLSASGIIRMKRFQKLSVWVSFVDDKSFTVVDESSLSIVFMGKGVSKVPAVTYLYH